VKRLLNNKKGTAEVIGTVLFIVILLFFFTNVYLWHDAATKEMNQEYLNKINSPITVVIQKNDVDVDSPFSLNVTNRGGVDTTLFAVWTIEDSTYPGGIHGSDPNDEVVSAGKSILIPINPSEDITYTYKVITVNGNSASCTFP
jgi:hypothetical protein